MPILSKAARVPFALFRNGCAVTALPRSFCIRSFYTTPIIKPIAKGVIPDIKTAFVTMEDRTCKAVSDIAKSLATKKILIPSEDFRLATLEVGKVIQDDDALHSRMQGFNVGKLQTVVFEGEFAEVSADVELRTASGGVQHIEKEGERPDFRKAQDAFNRSVPDILFSSALAGEARIIRDVDGIDSVNPQYPHVDFSESTKLGEVFKADLDLVFFAGRVTNPYPNIVTAAIPASVIMSFFSEEEIKFLSEKNFAQIIRDQDGKEVYSNKFAIWDGASLRWDGLVGDKLQNIVAINRNSNIDEKKLFHRISQVSAFLLHNDLVPTFSLDTSKKAIIRNYGKEGNVLHLRVLEPPVAEGGIPSYSADPQRLFGEKVAHLPVPKGENPRQIIRVGFAPLDGGDKSKDIPRS